MERLKFLSIVSGNLDEFFMIRVAGLKQQAASAAGIRDISGMTPSEQLGRIGERVHKMVAEQTAGIQAVLRGLAERGLTFPAWTDLTSEQDAFLAAYFSSEIRPVLTPLAVAELDPFPILPGLALNVALLLDRPQGGAEPKIAVIPVPSALPRFIRVPSKDGIVLVRIEDVVMAKAGQLFRGRRVLAACPFRVTRDADVLVDDDDAGDLLRQVEDAVRSRRRRAVVRLAIGAGCHAKLREWLVAWFEVGEEDVYEVSGALDAAAWMKVAARPGFEGLHDEEWPPVAPRDLVGRDDLWQALRDHDALLFHPYESFDPVVRLVELAADDPDVLAIKQTFYRAGPNSPIIAALARAAENGKQVTALVEL